jgi:hypothetical protein
MLAVRVVLAVIAPKPIWLRPAVATSPSREPAMAMRPVREQRATDADC